MALLKNNLLLLIMVAGIMVIVSETWYVESVHFLVTQHIMPILYINPWLRLSWDSHDPQQRQTATFHCLALNYFYRAFTGLNSEAGHD